jgi:hypothetical protein
VAENTAWRRIFGPKKGELSGGHRKLNNNEFHNLYSSPNIISGIWTGHVAHMMEMRSAYKIFIRNPKGKK